MMSTKRKSVRKPVPAATIREAAVWIDDGQALIVARGPDSEETIELIDRMPGESTVTFEARTVDEVLDEDRIFVRGPAAARLEFERSYTAVTHRPDRIVDVGSVATLRHRA
jgi:hypothetical protein